MTALLRIENVTRLFGGVKALSDISFDVEAGEIVGLIGPNGAGKTTLINCITGVFPPTAGRILFKGNVISGLPPHKIGRLGVSRTFQVVKPFRNLSVLENVAVGAMFGRAGSRRTTSQAFERAAEVLKKVRLDHRADLPAEGLTIVDRKRLELAKALAMEPELLLLDEVMAGLRGAEVDEAIDLIREIHAGGVTILLIEHVMKVVLGVSRRIVVLSYGGKIAEGPPEEVVQKPEVIAAYLGSRYARTAEAV